MSNLGFLFYWGKTTRPTGDDRKARHYYIMATKALLVAGAHHRVGSELLTRLLRVVCRAVARRKSACVIDAETSALQPTPLNASALVALHARRGVRCSMHTSIQL